MSDSGAMTAGHPGIARIAASEEFDLPASSTAFGDDPHKTPMAVAVVLDAREPDPMGEAYEMLSSRVERLQDELLLALQEKKAMTEIADRRSGRCTELLFEARHAKRLVRAYLESKKTLEDWAAADSIAGALEGSASLDGARDRLTKAREALEEWAAGPL